MAEPTLIPWDQVAEGPVWFRFSGDAEWLYGVKLKRLGILLGPGNVPYYATDIPYLQFTPAEQQPGEWAAVREDIARLDAVLKAGGINDLAFLTGMVQAALEDATRLRDGLAALEQEMREHCASGQPAFDSQIREWVDDLAALRAGQ